MKSEEVINFWFNELSPKQWWIKDSDFDKAIETRFKKVHQKAINCELFSWRETPLGRLAEIIVIDQFSRNIYRGRKESFWYDSLALSLSQELVKTGSDKELSDTQVSFAYMPYMHSESQVIHIEAVKLYSSREALSGNLDFEMKHKKIIDRFDRYPHRNEILGRTSTPEELEFLKQPNSSF